MQVTELVNQYNGGCRNFSEYNLSYANLRGINLSGADLSWVNFSHAYLGSVDLSNTNLSNADLHYANLTNANLTNADLTDAELGGVDLSTTILAGVKGLSTPEQEMEVLKWIKEEIVNHDRLDMSEWHSWHSWHSSIVNKSYQNLISCGTTHCAAGSSQLWAILNLPDSEVYARTPAVIVGSMLIPSVAYLFYASNDEFIEGLDDILAGKKPLLAR